MRKGECLIPALIYGTQLSAQVRLDTIFLALTYVGDYNVRMVLYIHSLHFVIVNKFDA